MPIRVYKFLEKQFALKTLYERRFKIAKVEELNDPFDLVPFDMSNPSVRQAMTGTRTILGKKLGLICFSAKYTDPVIWAHYSNKHTGMCLGFDIPESDEPMGRRIKPVQYIETSLNFPLNFKQMHEDDQNPVIWDMLYKKFKHWAYEEELRLWAYVNEEEDGIYYANFEDGVTQLVEVIVGANCTTPRKAIERALEMGGFKNVMIKKMRPAHSGFCMEDDPDWK
jgi:hypothetical protein